ncbi:MAG: alpha/beta fold hydrolase, partial [Lautropia sp.]
MTLEYIREGQGPALLLLHGVGGDAGNWSAVAARLRDRFTLIAPDLRGHGRSEPIRGPVDVHDLARDVGAVLDVAGIECCGVAGFSLGGVVAQALALDFPERVARLAVIGTVCGRTADEQARARERVDFLARNGVAAIAEANRARWFTDAVQAAH